MADDGNPVPEPMDWDKATPEQAYAEAQRRIAAAKASGASDFKFDLKTLARIPPEIVQLDEVRRMHLGDAEVSDLRPLMGLTSLKELHIYRVPVIDISPLCALTGLEYFALSQVPATDLVPLGRMTFLKILALEYGMPITDLAFLAPLQGLETLVLSESRGLSDLAPLAKLKSLKYLDVSDTQVSDVSALAGLPSLATFWLRNTPLSDIAPLSRLTSLKLLDLAGTQVANLSALAKLKELTELDLDGTQVSDLVPLENATNLRTLNIEGTGVSDLGPIAEFRGMIDQWTTNEEGDEVDCAWDEDEEYERRGLHYADTPVARRQPYCWLVALTPGRRTIETINYVRAARSLTTCWPEEYEPAEGSIFDRNRGPKEEIRELLRKIQERLRVGAPLTGFTNRVFVVHGHDHELKDNVAAFLDGLGLESVVLHREPNRGQTIIEKFEQSAEVGFAVVLLTPDDTVAGGGRRARQNVILELGYFIGRLGRHRVCALKKGDVELPSDILGVLFTAVDAAGQWQVELRRELEAAEYQLRR